jgi:hypothetical protein
MKTKYLPKKKKFSGKQKEKKTLRQAAFSHLSPIVQRKCIAVLLLMFLTRARKGLSPYPTSLIRWRWSLQDRLATTGPHYFILNRVETLTQSVTKVTHSKDLRSIILILWQFDGKPDRHLR